ncbi:MAG: S9 family peptidase [Acidobacteria bacterium]|nr:S9 family peptidase [Acidobacteriota bacterium]MCB9398293.1 S9 family peptidase [Acidobacteriota bacterium]
MLRFFLPVLCLWVAAQEPAKPVTWEMAFRNSGPELIGRISRPVQWLDSSHIILAKTNGQLVSLDIQSQEEQAYSNPKPTGRGIQADTSPDLKSWVWVENNDIFVQSEGSEKRPLTANPGEEQNPTFAPDAQKIAFTREGNLFVTDLNTGLEKQLTNDQDPLITNGYASWVYYEEILGRESNYRAFWWSPDSQKIAFMRFDDHPVHEFLIYHPGGTYGEWEKTRYPKSGDTNPQVRFGIYDLSSQKVTWMDFDPTEDAYLAWPFWTPDSQTLHVQWLNRGQDTLRIYACDPKTGSKKAIYEEKQPSWVEFFADITYLADGSGFLLRSDKDGYNHLYYHAMDGKLQARLTQGNWRVLSIEAVDEKDGYVYFIANRDDSAGKELFRVDLKGKKIEKISQSIGPNPDPKGRASTGSHSVLISPDFKSYIETVSDFWRAPSLRMGKVGSDQVQVLETAEDNRADFITGKIQYFEIPGPDGYQFPTCWVLPADFDPSGAKKYGVIFRIYSGPDAPTVKNAYSPYQSLDSWTQHYYAAQGIITITVDHRASGHFGKKGIASMHRSFGQYELKDLTAAAEWLKSKPYIDPQRIGITGHSYGGYMTILAMTGAPDTFTHGVAGAPVTDWSLYDTVYTERYMDTPQENPEGYKKGSLLEHAKNLKGPLRLIHGGIDDNVHFQNSEQLIEIWTQSNIPFEFMLYPTSRHGIRAFQHWLDGQNRFWFRYFLNREFAP